MINDDEEINLKIILLGCDNSGKTCILTRYVEGRFDHSILKTLHPSISTKRINIGYKSIRLDIWETPGDENLRKLVKIIYKNTNAIILVYDIIDKCYFENLKNYWNSILKDSLPKDASKKNYNI